MAKLLVFLVLLENQGFSDPPQQFDGEIVEVRMLPRQSELEYTIQLSADAKDKDLMNAIFEVWRKRSITHPVNGDLIQDVFSKVGTLKVIEVNQRILTARIEKLFDSSSDRVPLTKAHGFLTFDSVVRIRNRVSHIKSGAFRE